MERTPSFLAFESLLDLSKKASIKKNREYEENDKFCFYRNFTSLSWYSRLNINSLPERDEKILERIKTLCTESTSPKYISFAAEDVYNDLNNDLERIGFKPVKSQKGMILDLEGSKEYDKNDSIVRIDKKRLPEWVDTCERGFNKSVNCPIFDILINDKNCMFFGYIADGRIVSTALLNICGANGGIHEVATLESHRNRGCATELIKHIINEGKKSGCEILTLQASVYGEPVYKKLGFKPVSQIYNYMP